MKINCAYCGRELNRPASRAKRRCFCTNSEVMLFYYGNSFLKGSELVKRAHDALRAKGWNRGRPNLKLRGDNNPAKRPDVRAKISGAKLENNWMTGRTGPLHHLYEGGKIWWRGAEWNATKLRTRIRDAFMCADCDMTEVQHLEKCGQPLQVHHLIPYRISHDNSSQNLVTLCSYHHGKRKSEDHAIIEASRPYLPVAA